MIARIKPEAWHKPEPEDCDFREVGRVIVVGDDACEAFAAGTVFGVVVTAVAIALATAAMRALG